MLWPSCSDGSLLFFLLNLRSLFGLLLRFFSLPIGRVHVLLLQRLLLRRKLQLLHQGTARLISEESDGDLLLLMLLQSGRLD